MSIRTARCGITGGMFIILLTAKFLNVKKKCILRRIRIMFTDSLWI